MTKQEAERQIAEILRQLEVDTGRCVRAVGLSPVTFGFTYAESVEVGLVEIWLSPKDGELWGPQ